MDIRTSPNSLDTVWEGKPLGTYQLADNGLSISIVQLSKLCRRGSMLLLDLVDAAIPKGTHKDEIAEEYRGQKQKVNHLGWSQERQKNTDHHPFIYLSLCRWLLSNELRYCRMGCSIRTLCTNYSTWAY
jgi:hypothetical protein